MILDIACCGLQEALSLKDIYELMLIRYIASLLQGQDVKHAPLSLRDVAGHCPNHIPVSVTTLGSLQSCVLEQLLCYLLFYIP